MPGSVCGLLVACAARSAILLGEALDTVAGAQAVAGAVINYPGKDLSQQSLDYQTARSGLVTEICLGRQRGPD
jgi:hypothetical protein